MAYEQFFFTHKNISKNVFLIDMKAEPHPFFSELMSRGINKSLRKKNKVLIICNKNSYAKGLICSQCGDIPQCKQCDITISYHKTSEGQEFGLCHLCKSYYSISSSCTICQKGELKAYGIGIDQINEYIVSEHKTKPLIIKAQTANSLAKTSRIKEDIDKYHVAIGTSLVTTARMPWKNTKGVTILLHADAPLALPDYQSQSNCFYFIFDTIIESPHQNIIIQTQKSDHPTVRLACAGKKKEFEISDNKWKKEHNYPPFGQICLLLYKNEIEQNVFTTINKLYQELLFFKEKHNTQSNETIEVYATPPLVYKAYNKYRYHIIIKGKNIREFIEKAYQELRIGARGFKVDRQAREII